MKNRRFLTQGMWGLSCLVTGTPVLAVGTTAGTSITNTAVVHYLDPLGTAETASSNTYAFHVDEVLNVTVVSNNASNVTVSTPESNAPLSFKVTNTGNGSEPFVLSYKNNLTGDQFDPTNSRIYIDNGDGVFDPTVDTLYVPGTNDPVLGPDATKTLFVVSDIPASRNNGDVGLASLTAESVTAATASGVSTPGTTFAGKGDNGTDAVVGNTHGQGTAQGGYVVSTAQATLTKSQSVTDPYGGSNPVQGATVTYTLVFAATGNGSISGVKVVDPIPANTTYVAGSITLDGAPLTDASDADVGDFNSSQIEVALNNVTAPATHTVTFKVKIN